MVRKEVKVLRLCGYRKIGALYLVGSLLSRVCDRFPFKLVPCPQCGRLHEFNRGVTKTSGKGIFHTEHLLDAKRRVELHAETGKWKDLCFCEACPACRPDNKVAALVWIGKKFYSTESFKREANSMGVSKRLPYIPKWLEIGNTWVFLAHPEAVDAVGVPGTGENGKKAEGKLFDKVPGVFHAFVAERVEKIMTEMAASQLSQEEIDKLDAQGIDIVTVPGSDPDHR